MDVRIGDPQLAREVMVGQTIRVTVELKVSSVDELGVHGVLTEDTRVESKRGSGGLNPNVERARKILTRTMGTIA